MSYIVPERHITVAARNGIVRPVAAAEIAGAVGLPFRHACTLLTIESYGGKNVWGGDAGGVFSRLPDELTRATHRAYLHEVFENNRTPNGRGPCQITHPSYDERAEREGLELWRPYHNMVLGFTVFYEHLTRPGTHPRGRVWAAARLYNGSEAYADKFVLEDERWKELLWA
jgi:hypothetical protein